MSSTEPLLLQQEHGGDDELTPWRVVVVSLMCQQTTGTQVRKVLGALFERWPTPELMSAAGDDLESLLRPCGFAYRRAGYLRGVSRGFADWLADGVRTTAPFAECESPSAGFVRRLTGCGEYTEQAYRLIVLNDTSFRPDDKELVKLWRWRRAVKRTQDRA